MKKLIITKEDFDQMDDFDQDVILALLKKLENSSNHKRIRKGNFTYYAKK